MGLRNIRWGYVLGAVIAAEAIMVAAAFAWVAVYSYILNPGQEDAAYQKYAERASPYVALTLGFPVFFAVCRWIGRRDPARALATALIVFGVFCLIELPILLSEAGQGLPAWFLPVSLSTKLLGCCLGGMSAARREAVKPA